jgi:hypothetical protein
MLYGIVSEAHARTTMHKHINYQSKMARRRSSGNDFGPSLRCATPSFDLLMALILRSLCLPALCIGEYVLTIVSSFWKNANLGKKSCIELGGVVRGKKRCNKQVSRISWKNMLRGWCLLLGACVCLRRRDASVERRSATNLCDDVGLNQLRV